jgi:hypothetical protein
LIGVFCYDLRSRPFLFRSLNFDDLREKWKTERRAKEIGRRNERITVMW